MKNMIKLTKRDRCTDHFWIDPEQIVMVENFGIHSTITLVDGSKMHVWEGSREVMDKINYNPDRRLM